MGAQVTLVDAGTGNLHSVLHALQAAGAQVRLTQNAEDLKDGGRIVLPGVGAFGRFMAGLSARGLDQAIRAAARRGDPLLGICVGMQAFFEVGLELGRFAGLGLLPGQVVRFPAEEGVKVPHTGWNQVSPQKACSLLEGLDEGEFAYFNHSYYCQPADFKDVAALTDYGQNFTSVVQHGNLLGVQFHPEKSQRVGQAILKNFMRL